MDIAVQVYGDIYHVVGRACRRVLSCAVIVPPLLGWSSCDAFLRSSRPIDPWAIKCRTTFLFLARGFVRSRASGVCVMKDGYSVRHILFHEVLEFPGIVLIFFSFD